MRIVAIINRYRDMQLNRWVNEGEVLEVDNARAEQLVNAKVGQVTGSIPDVAPEITTDTEQPLKTPAALGTSKKTEESKVLKPKAGPSQGKKEVKERRKRS